MISNIDWKLLREQKMWLLEQDGEAAAGLLHLVDALQDHAVLFEGISELEVFGHAMPCEI